MASASSSEMTTFSDAGGELGVEPPPAFPLSGSGLTDTLLLSPTGVATGGLYEGLAAQEGWASEGRT